MRLHHVLTTAASLAVLSIAAPALAQSPAPPPEGEAPATTPLTDPAAPVVGEEEAMPPAGDPASDVATSADAPAVIPTSSPTPVEQAYLLKAGDPTVTSNQPIPDTPSTRAATGGPDSNGGRKTRAVGN